MSVSQIETRTAASSGEMERRARFLQMFRNNPLPQAEVLANLGLFLNRQAVSRILFTHELYQRALPIHGVVMEFGTRWGQNAALFANFRGIYEPYNYTRRIIAFDTFAGYAAVGPKDGLDAIVRNGAYGVTPDYEEYLEALLTYHESESPLSHLTKHELVKGDCGVTLADYLDRHPETIVALAYFDLDLYEPTYKCLRLLRNYLTRGSVIGFDELNFAAFPGETIAVREVLGLDRYSIQRSVLSPTASYVLVE